MEKIKSCKSTHGKYNLDNGNIVIQVDVELDTKEITKNIAIEVEDLMNASPDLLEAAEKVIRVGLAGYDDLRKAIHKAKGELTK